MDEIVASARLRSNSSKTSTLDCRYIPAMPPEYSNTLELQSPDQPGLEAFGYSSSSESDEAPNKSNTNNNQNVKKKKKRTTPQKSINKIWRRFASKQPNKALAILPFDPVPLPTTSERPNELLDAGYERARDECSRKVKKIIQECRRVNMRYRDPGFDLVQPPPPPLPLRGKLCNKTLTGNCTTGLGSQETLWKLSELSRVE